MAHVAPVSSRLVFGDTSVPALGALRWLPPAILGLCAPMVAGLMVFPRLIDEARFFIAVVLCALVVICAIAYTLSVLNPGPITGLDVDRKTRQIGLVREGLFAVSTRQIAFEDVQDLRMASRSDDDGYAIDVPILRLRSGESLTLPAAITSADITGARRLLGLSVSAR
jgi:hypothetical protein